MQLLRLSLWTKYYDVIIQKKPFKRYIHVMMVLFLRGGPSFCRQIFKVLLSKNLLLAR